MKTGGEAIGARTAIWLIAALTVAIGTLWAAPSVLAGSSTVTCATPLDDFNRADGTNLGSKWTEQAPDPALLGGQVTGAGTALMTFNGQAADEACVDAFANPAGGGYVALVLRFGENDKNVFVKVQDQNGADGTFDTAYFYRGNNGDPWPGGTSIVPLTPFATGRIHLAISGTTVTLDVDNNGDDVVDQTVSKADLPSTGRGVDIGLGVYGGAMADNFAMTDNLAPETIKGGKKLNKARGRARFRFSSNDSGAGFRCKLDTGAFRKCASPKRLKNLDPGKHEFQVRAVDRVGNVDASPIVWKFRIPRP